MFKIDKAEGHKHILPDDDKDKRIMLNPNVTRFWNNVDQVRTLKGKIMAIQVIQNIFESNTARAYTG